MNKIILLTILIGLNVHAQHAHAISLMLVQHIQAQEKQLDLKMQLQNQKIGSLQNQVDKEIENLQNQVDKAINHQALRKAVLDRQENSIDLWLSVLGIILTIFTIVAPIAMWVFKTRVDKDINQIKETKQEVEKIKQKAEQYLDDIEVMKDNTINAQKNAEHPEDTKTIIKKAKEQGTELDKLIASAFELQNQKSTEKAINKWREILQQAYQINNQNLQASCYFNLGYLYHDNNKFYLAVEFYKKTIEIKPNKYEAYNNMGIVYAELGKYQQALEAYQKAIKIKPDYHKAYYNIGNAYDAMKNFDKAIDNYNIAIKINPSIGKEIDSEDWKILTHRIKALNDSTIKQQYQEIFNQLKGEQNKK